MSIQALNRVYHEQPSWLQALRQQSAAQFAETGFPSPRDEEWRYTNISAIEKKGFTAVAAAQVTDLADAWAEFQLEDAWQVVFVDGYLQPALSNLGDLGQGLSVQSLQDAWQDTPELMQSYLGQAVTGQENGFVAFNMAQFSTGVLIRVVAKSQVTKPVQILHIVTSNNALACTRTVIVAETHSELEVIETFVGTDTGYLSAAVTEVFVEANASLTATKVQVESAKAYHFGGLYVKQARDARFRHHNFAFGGLLARTDVHSDLDTAAECHLNGLYLGSKRQHLDNHTRINHLKAQGISRETYKGVLAERARGVFQGRVVVAEDAQKTDSEMNNRNLLLSNEAEADTKPQLEIYADDVKCAHGVTVGQLDEKSVFYLQSRGIDEATARNMLTFAFANEMVDKIRFKSLRDLVLAQLLARFPQESVNKAWL